MARVSEPDWSPSPISIAQLPQLTTVAYVATRRAAATGIEVRYRLVGPEVRFRPSAKPLPDSETPGSQPPPTPVSRNERVIVDTYDAEDGTVRQEISRDIEIELTGAGAPGLVLLEVTVSDLGIPNGECASTVCRKGAVVSFTS